jgi:hypothetical protein
MDVLYLCDKKACEKCNSIDCRHTTDIEHAVSFEKGPNGYYVEKQESGSDIKSIVEFIEQLSIETTLSFGEASSIVNFIYNKTGSLKTAQAIYKQGSVYALKIYIDQLNLGNCILK